jgi:putative transposase
MEMKSSPGYRALRKGRISQVSARYFLTVCTFNRKPLLCSDSNPKLIFQSLQECHEVFELIAWVVMPDHMHLVIRLKEESLPLAMRALKSRSAIAVNRCLKRKGQLWQPVSFDHKFRSDEDLGPILSYTWNNPPPPGKNFRCRKEEWLRFKSMVTQEVDYPEWLRANPMG